MISRCDTFLTGEEDDETLHLWVVVTPPIDGEVVIVSITTRRRTSETILVLRKGDHPFIEHDSVPACGYARIESVEQIEHAIKAGTAKAREPMPDSLTQRILGCVRESDFTPNGVRHYLNGIANN